MAVPRGSVEDVWENGGIASGGGEVERGQEDGLYAKKVESICCPVPRPLWHKLQPGGQAEAIGVLYTTHAFSKEAERTMIQL